MVAPANQNGSKSAPNQELKFPVVWHGSLLMYAEAAGNTPDIVRKIFSVFGLADGTVETGNTSKTGRYVTFHLTCTVEDKNTLEALFDALSGLPGVRMLL